MKKRYFIFYVLLAMVVEYFIRLVFIGHLIVIVPEIIIFLTILDIQDKKILTKFLLSVILYDVWASSQLGTITIAMLMTFLVLYFVGQISFISDKRARTGFLRNVLTLTIFSDILFLVYYLADVYLVKIFMWFNYKETEIIFTPPILHNLLQICIMASVIFLVCYSSYKYITRPRRFKL